MRRNRSVAFIVAVFMSLSLLSCGENTVVITNNNHSGLGGVYVMLESIDYSGDNPIFNAVWYNETEIDVEVESWCCIEYKRNENKWMNTNTCGADVVREESPLITLKAGENVKIDYSLWPYDISERGVYRIKGGFSQSIEGEKKYHSAWVEFNVERSGRKSANQKAAAPKDSLPVSFAKNTVRGSL